MKRWIILGLGMGANLAQGVAYSLSVIAVPLLVMVGIVAPELAGSEDPKDLEEVARLFKANWPTIFTFSVMFLPIGMMIGGVITKSRGPRISIALGAVLYGGGLIASSLTTSYNVLCFTLGMMLSIGSGLAYGPIVASAVRWFPDRRGLASGLVVGALGFGPVFIAPFCSVLYNSWGFGIPSVLQFLGIFALIAIGAASFISVPPETPVESKKETEASAKAESADVPGKKVDFTWSEMLRKVDFWILFLLFFLGTAPGLMVLGTGKELFVKVGGFSPALATTLVGVLAAANALGRILWGAISDYLGRVRTLRIMFLFSSVAMLLLPAFSNFAALWVLVVLIVGTTFGGYLGLFPSFCADAFGPKNMSLNYAILFFAFSAASFAGPKIYGSIGKPDTAFFLAASLSIIGLATTIAFSRRMEKKTL